MGRNIQFELTVPEWESLKVCIKCGGPIHRDDAVGIPIKACMRCACRYYHPELYKKDTPKKRHMGRCLCGRRIPYGAKSCQDPVCKRRVRSIAIVQGKRSLRQLKSYEDDLDINLNRKKGEVRPPPIEKTILDDYIK